MWALGCLLYKALVRRTPFEAPGSGAVNTGAILSAEYRWPEHTRASAPLKQVVAACLTVRAAVAARPPGHTRV